MTDSPIHVDVNLQDYFFAEALDEGDGGETEETGSERSLAPISPETWETWFHQWLEALNPALSSHQAYELSLRLTDDAEIQSLNTQYLHKNQPTDVLSFPTLEVDYPQLAEEETTSPTYLGDIVISVETAHRQAAEFGHSLQHELAWLASHALLHLLGWDHPDEASLTRMLKQQVLLLQIVGLSIDYYQIEKLLKPDYLDTETCEV